MTLNQIIAQALRQLDEDPEDAAEFEVNFKIYANMGYDIAQRDYYKPRSRFNIEVGNDGTASVDATLVTSSGNVTKTYYATRIVELRDLGDGKEVYYEILPEKDKIYILDESKHGKNLSMLAEYVGERLTNDDDVPGLPEFAHPALADYICYKHLSNGNLAKQSRAQYYLQSFYQTMQRLRPNGMGSVRRYKNFYEVTDVTYVQ